jgi:mRNA-degrading endonuclease RelE of RelBE toxin-antitoxin system
MTFSVLQTRRFARQYKKLHDNVAADVDAAVVSVSQAPHAGERKKGDLSDLWVQKFKSQGQLFLLGYTLDENVRLVYLEAIGPHENFYRDLKRS